MSRNYLYLLMFLLIFPYSGVAAQALGDVDDQDATDGVEAGETGDAETAEMDHEGEVEPADGEPASDADYEFGGDGPTGAVPSMGPPINTIKTSEPSSCGQVAFSGRIWWAYAAAFVWAALRRRRSGRSNDYAAVPFVRAEGRL